MLTVSAKGGGRPSGAKPRSRATSPDISMRISTNDSSHARDPSNETAASVGVGSNNGVQAGGEASIEVLRQRIAEVLQAWPVGGGEGGARVPVRDASLGHTLESQTGENLVEGDGGGLDFFSR